MFSPLSPPSLSSSSPSSFPAYTFASPSPVPSFPSACAIQDRMLKDRGQSVTLCVLVHIQDEFVGFLSRRVMNTEDVFGMIEEELTES